MKKMLKVVGRNVCEILFEYYVFIKSLSVLKYYYFKYIEYQYTVPYQVSISRVE